MLIDLTLCVTPQLRKNAQGQEEKAFTGHLGTHFDVMDKEFPLEYVRRKGVLFDVSGNVKLPGEAVEPGEAEMSGDTEIPADTEITLSAADLSAVPEGAFVMFRTGCMERFGYGTEPYSHRHPVLSWELIDALIAKKVAMIGIDCAGIQRGAEHTRADQRCADHGTFVIENLCHLEQITACMEGSRIGQGGMMIHDFTVNTFPMNFSGMSGLPCRVVAEIDETSANLSGYYDKLMREE